MKLNLFLCAIFSAISLPALADGSLGKELKFASENDQPKFSVRVKHDSNPSANSWELKFTLNGEDLYAGQATRKLAWRFFDKHSGAYLSEWREQYVYTEDQNYSGPTEFTFETGIPVFDAAQNSESLIIAIYSGTEALNGWNNVSPTHFIDLSSYCSSSADHFQDLSTNQAGCGKLGKPNQPFKFPAAQAKVADVDGAVYCGTVSLVAKDAAQVKLPFGIQGQLTRELKLAKIICGPSDKFLGFREIKDANIRAMVNASLVRDALGRLMVIAKRSNLGSAALVMMHMNDFQQDLRLGYEPSLYEAYPDLNGELRDTKAALDSWAVDLSDYYRNQ